MNSNKIFNVVVLITLMCAYNLLATETGTVEQNTANKAEAYYRYAYAHYLEVNDDLEGALKNYQIALEKDPLATEIKVGIASIYHRRQQDQEALKMLEEVIKADPQNGIALKEYAQICYEIGNSTKDNKYFEKAIEALEKLKSITPQDASVYAHLGKLYELLGKKDNAIKLLSEYIKLQPGSLSAYESLAELYEDKKDYKAAAEVYEPLIEKSMLDTQLIAKLLFLYNKLRDESKIDRLFQKSKDFLDNEEILLAFASTYAGMKKFDKAESLYAILYKNNPTDNQLVGDYVESIEKSKSSTKAIEFLENHLKVYGQSLALGYQLALLHEQLAQWDKAEEIIQGLLTKLEQSKSGLNSDDDAMMKTLYVQMGFICQQRKKHKEAIEYYKKAEEFSPLDSKVEFMLAYNYFRSKDYDKALELLDKIQVKDEFKATFEVLRAQIFEAKGEPAKAVKLLQDLLSKEPSNTEYLSELVQLYERTKDYASAENILKTYVSKNDKNEHVYFLLGAVCERQKKFKDAEEYFKKAIKIKPDYAEALNYLGFMYIDRGEKLNESIKYVEKALELYKNNGAFLDSLGWGYYKLNKLDRAEEYLKKAVENYPENAVIYDHLGDVYIKQGKIKEAIAQWELALKNKNEEIDVEKIVQKIKNANVALK